MVEKSEILRVWINGKLDSNYDYSQTANRSSDFKDFLESEDAKKNGLNPKDHKSLYYSILRKCCVDRGLDPATYGLKRSQSPRVKKDMVSKITPKPKPGQGFQEKESKEDTSDTDESTDDSEEQAPVVDLEMAKLTCNFTYELIRVKYRTWSPLTEEEQDSLGKAWLRLMQKYMTSKYWEFVMPAVATIGILRRKANEASTKNPPKDKTPEEKDPAAQQKKEQESKPQQTEKKAGWLENIGVDKTTLESSKTADKVGKEE